MESKSWNNLQYKIPKTASAQILSLQFSSIPQRQSHNFYLCIIFLHRNHHRSLSPPLNASHILSTMPPSKSLDKNVISNWSPNWLQKNLLVMEYDRKEIISTLFILLECCVGCRLSWDQTHSLVQSVFDRQHKLWCQITLLYSIVQSVEWIVSSEQWWMWGFLACLLPADCIKKFLSQDSLWWNNLSPSQNKLTEDTIFMLWIQY